METGKSLVISQLFLLGFLSLVNSTWAIPVASESNSTETAPVPAPPSELPSTASVAPETEPEVGQPGTAQPRYRLVSPAVDISVGKEEHKTEADFTWQALTKNGPASGDTPKIGEVSGQSYFDFRDGLEHPYYILKLKKQ